MPRSLLALVLSLFGCVFGGTALAINPDNVLVLYNDDQGVSGAGFQIAQHYQQVRPGVHVVPITGVDPILTGAFNEDVSGQDYLDIIRPQVLSAIGNIPDVIDVIVTTKGMPLRIDVGTQPAGNTSPNWERYSSMESELARVDSIDTTDKMGDQFFNSAFPQIDQSLPHNPYYNKNNINTPFAHKGSGGFFNPDFRLAARLDGYSVESVNASIDRAQNVFIVPTAHYIILDDTGIPSVDQITNDTGPGQGTLEVITGLYPDDGMTNPVPVFYDHTDAAITSSSRKVLGYVSHGTNDGDSFGLNDNYLGEFVAGVFQPGEVQFDLSNGAVFHTHESFNAQSFDPQNTQNQGLVADWLEIGGTAGLGHVAEPLNGHVNVTNEDLFYRMLLPSGGAAAVPGEQGMTLVESTWYATRQLSFVNTVVGDPLMTIQAWLPGDTNLDGRVEFNDFYTLQGNWQQAGTFADGDFTGDGIVDDQDFAILQSNWLVNSNAIAVSEVDIEVVPVANPNTGWPTLSATLLSDANLDGDLDVDGGDLAEILATYGVDAEGDVDGDEDTDGFDFLAWQQQYYLYELEADFDFDAQTGANDAVIWGNSYATNLGGDANDDGRTNGLDFLAWQREVEVSVSSQIVSTPEPGCLLLVGFAALIVSLLPRATALRLPSVR